MRIAIYGVGAVGGYYGGRLAQAGEEVIFIARGENLKTLKANGLRVDSVFGDLQLPQVQATDNPAEVGIVDVIIPCVKTFQVPQIAPAMLPMVGPDTMVVTTQNGVIAPYEFGEVLGMEHVLGGAVKLFAVLSAPGHIIHSGGPGIFVFGEFNHQSTPRAQRFFEALQKSPGVTPEISLDIEADLWAKQMLIGAIGGVGSVTRAPVGIMRSLPETRALLENCMREIYEVALARGVHLPEDAVAKSMAYADAQPALGTSSTQRDIIAGRLSEMDTLIGAVVRMGHAAGLPVPTLSSIYAALLPTDLRARGELEFTS